MDIQKYLENKKLWLLVILVLVILTLTTTYYGSTDIGDYADSARLFAGKYRADIRNSHSYVFGFFHAPYFFLFNNWLVFKISSLVFLLATVFSVYYIKNKDKRFLWLMLLSPAVWYMAPWINPIQIASLGMLWSWFFIQKYDESNGPRILLYSGIFLGLAWAFWNTILFLGFFLWAVFLMNKKLYHTITFFIGTMIGLMPLFLLDYSLFGFPFYTLIKTTMSNFVATLLGGIYGGSSSSFSVLNVVLLLLTIPLFFWPNLKKISKTNLFLMFSLLLFLVNPQIRYAMSIIPIMVASYKIDKYFKATLIFSLAISLIFIVPYIYQVKSPLATPSFQGDIKDLIENKKFASQTEINSRIISDLSNIALDYPRESFIVGPNPDDYGELARLYWRDDIVEFVSIQDYQAHLNDDFNLFSKEWRPIPKFNERRQIWVSGGMSVNENDPTNFTSLRYAISTNSENIEGFILIKSYDQLNLWEKNQ